jgi:AcrR family transcriptional regulator
MFNRDTSWTVIARVLQKLRASGTCPTGRSTVRTMEDLPFFDTEVKNSEVRATKEALRRSAVMRAGLEVFTEKGFHLASMDDIAERAGVSKPILYQHFSSKHELYLGILDERVDAIVQQVRGAIDAAKTNKTRLEAAISCYFTLVDDADLGYRLIFESDFTMNHDVRARVEDVVSQVSRIVGAEVSKQTGMSLGEANILAGGLSGMAQASAWRWLRLGRPISIELAISQTLDLAWNGLTSIQVKESSPEAEVLHLEERIS